MNDHDHGAPREATAHQHDESLEPGRMMLRHPVEVPWPNYALLVLGAWLLFGPFSLGYESVAMTASLVLGVAWAAWHAPLFLMGGYFSSWDFSPDPGWYAFDVVVKSVLYTWLYNNTNRSVLAVIFFHFASNATGQLLDLSPAAQLYQTGAMTLLVVGVVLWWAPARLRRVER